MTCPGIHSAKRMNTNAVPTDALVNAAPPSWKPWILAGSAMLPFISRFAYGLYSGRGVVGAVHGLLFGTNQTKVSNPPASS